MFQQLKNPNYFSYIEMRSFKIEQIRVLKNKNNCFQYINENRNSKLRIELTFKKEKSY